MLVRTPSKKAADAQSPLVGTLLLQLWATGCLPMSKSHCLRHLGSTWFHQCPTMLTPRLVLTLDQCETQCSGSPNLNPFSKFKVHTTEAKYELNYSCWQLMVFWFLLIPYPSNLSYQTWGIFLNWNIFADWFVWHIVVSEKKNMFEVHIIVLLE